MDAVSGILAAVVFIVAFDRLGVASTSARAVRTSRGAGTVLGNTSLSDEEKERALRSASLSLAGDFVSIALRGLGVLALSGGVLLAFDRAGLSSISAASRWLLSWPALVGLALVGAGWFALRARS